MDAGFYEMRHKTSGVEHVGVSGGIMEDRIELDEEVCVILWQ